MLDLTDEQSYKDYFQNVATSHVDITGFRFGDEEELAVAAKTGLDSMVLWADRTRPVEMIDNRSDNFLAKRTSTIMVMGPDAEIYTDQHILFKQTEAIVIDIISKILMDFNDGYISTQFSKYKFGEGEVELSSIRYRGCRLDLHWEAPIDLSFKVDNWS